MNYSEELIKWSLKAYGEEPCRKIADIVCYESGDVLRDTIRIEDYPQDVSLYKRLAKTSIGDVLAMSQLLCSKLGFNFQEVYEEGCQRAIERCQEKMKGLSGF